MTVGGALPVLVFDLAEGRYGIPAAAVREIVRAVAVVAVAGAPRLVEGLVDVHGEVAAVVDLRAAFGLPTRPPLPNDHMIVVRTAARPLVLRVDRVAGVETASVVPVPAAVPAGSLEGWTRLPDGLALVHDVERFVSTAEGAALDALIRERGRT
jgi:purine-binding chemotaxis protein CheW